MSLEVMLYRKYCSNLKTRACIRASVSGGHRDTRHRKKPSQRSCWITQCTSKSRHGQTQLLLFWLWWVFDNFEFVVPSALVHLVTLAVTYRCTIIAFEHVGALSSTTIKLNEGLAIGRNAEETHQMCCGGPAPWIHWRRQNNTDKYVTDE